MAELKFPDFAGEDGATLAGTVITLAGSAVTNHRTFANAALDSNIDFSDGDTIAVDIIDTSGNTATWTATWASAGATITRVSLEAEQGTLSTSAGAISVYASVPGNWFKELESRNRWVSTAGTDADTPMVVNTTPYLVDMSAWVTAHRTYTLPATFAVGDVVDIQVTAGNATYALIIKPAAGDDINGGTAGAELTRLFITGERMRFRGTVANTSWMVEIDGRIPSRCKQDTNGQSEQSNLTDATFNTLTQVKTVVYDVGDLSDETNSQIILRRSGSYRCEANIFTNALYTGDIRLLVVGTDNGVASSKFQYTTMAFGASVNSIDTAVAGDVIYLQVRPDTGASEVDIPANSSQWFSVYEVLDK